MVSPPPAALSNHGFPKQTHASWHTKPLCSNGSGCGTWHGALLLFHAASHLHSLQTVSPELPSRGSSSFQPADGKLMGFESLLAFCIGKTLWCTWCRGAETPERPPCPYGALAWAGRAELPQPCSLQEGSGHHANAVSFSSSQIL